MKVRLFSLVGLILFSVSSCSQNTFIFESEFPADIERFWLGPEYWTNRLQDWRLKDGRIECLTDKDPLRTIHLLTRSLGPNAGNLEMSVRLGSISPEVTLDRSSWAGFLIGAGSDEIDYRISSLVHHGSGENGGLAAALDGEGHLVFYDNTNGLQFLEPRTLTGQTFSNREIELHLFLRPEGGTYSITLSASDPETGEILQQASLSEVDESGIRGNVALISHRGTFWFSDWMVAGSKVEVHEERAFGPVLSTLHTLSRNTLKMTAQLPPVSRQDGTSAVLQTQSPETQTWNTASEAEVVVPGWTATFKVENWDSTQDTPYRVKYQLIQRDGSLQDYFFTGVIPHDPVEKHEITVAGFTGNSNTHGSFGREFSFSPNRIWFPHSEIVEHVQANEPDFLVFTGDQVYESRPTAPDRRGGINSQLDYLYKWYLWCWSYNSLVRNIPAVCLPDDHDVYHGNIWGAGGRRARDLPEDGVYPAHYEGLTGHYQQDGGGYLMSPEFVNMVQRTQTSHLPDPVDPAPIEQGITVYFTDINYGGISFAVLEDRKFKSSPSVIVPEANVVNGFSQVPNFDMKKADVPGAELLGERQLSFIRSWAADWENTWMKVALSQTVFGTVSTYPKDFQTDAGTPGLPPLELDPYPEGYALSRDMDTNGWPQTGRNRALTELRKGFAFMLGGDQHLGSIVHHGVDTWDDAGFSFCVPSIANLWPRRWVPPEPGRNHQDGFPRYTGQYLDGFGNHITVWAVSNPVKTDEHPAALHDRAPGYGLVRLDKESQAITMECWPRHTRVGDPVSAQYPGWPLTISMEENYGREAVALLPEIQFKGIEDPVVQVIDSEDEIVYTVRIKGTSFTPKVFRKGTYTLLVGEPGTERFKRVEMVASLVNGKQDTLEVSFEP